MSSQRLCQYPLLDNPNRLCERPVSGQGASKSCEIHRDLWEQEQDRRYSLNRLTDLPEEQRKAEQTAERRYHRHTRRSIISCGSVAFLAFLLPEIQKRPPLDSVLSSSDNKTDQDEQAWKIISNLHHRILAAREPHKAIAFDAVFFVSQLRNTFNCYQRRDGDADRLRIGALHLLVTSGTSDYSYEQYLKLDGYARICCRFWKDNQEELRHAHALLVRYNLNRAFISQIPESVVSLQQHIRKRALWCAQEASRVLQGRLSGRMYKEGRTRTQVLLHHAFASIIRLTLFEKDPRISELALRYIPQLEDLARKLDLPQIWLGTLMDLSGYQAVVHHAPEKGQELLKKAREDYLPFLPLRSPPAVWGLLRAEIERAREAGDKESARAKVREYVQLYQKCPFAFNRAHLEVYLRTYEIDFRLEECEKPFLAPTLPLMDTDPLLRSFYGWH